MAKEKVNMYLLAIVAIVAIVGIVVLVLNAGTTFLPISEDDLTGQVYKKMEQEKAALTSDAQIMIARPDQVAASEDEKKK